MKNLRLGLIALACAALACSTLVPNPTPAEPPPHPTDTAEAVEATDTAEAPPPTDEQPEATETPAEAAATDTPAGPATVVRLVMASADHTTFLLDLDGNDYPTTDMQEPLYVFTYALNDDLAAPGRAFNISSAGNFALDVVTNVNQGFAAWLGPSAPNGVLAWDSYTVADTGGLNGEIHVSSPDGSDARVAYAEFSPDTVLRVWRWSADGQTLYFSKEPTGLGGYILFAGITNVWALNVSDGSVREVVPNIGQGIICIDDLSADEKIVSDHCTPGPVAGVETVGQGPLTVVAAPFETLTGAQIAGDVTLSPDASRLAFAVAAGNPEAEQGWVAVSDGLGVTSHLVATADPGEYFHIVQWLDADTLLLQSEGANPGVYKAAADGSGATRLGDGTVLGVIDNVAGQP